MNSLGIYLQNSDITARYEHPQGCCDFLNPQELPFSLDLHFKNNNEMFLGNMPDLKDAVTIDNLWEHFCDSRAVEHENFSCDPAKLVALQIKRMIMISGEKYGLDRSVISQGPDSGIAVALPSYIGFYQRSSLTRAFIKADMKKPVFVSRARAAARDLTFYNQKLLSKKFILMPFFDDLGMEISLISFDSAGEPVLSGTSATRSYTSRDVENHLSELLYKKSELTRKISRKNFYELISDRISGLLEQICTRGTASTDLCIPDVKKKIHLVVTAAELSVKCSKIAKKLIEKTRNLIKESGFFTEQIELLVPFGSSLNLPCFKNSLDLFLGDIPVIRPGLDQKINCARGAALLTPAADKDPGSLPISMDTGLCVALQDGSTLPVITAPARGNSQAANTFKAYACPGEADSIEIMLLEGQRPRAAENSFIGSLTMPASSGSMELDITISMTNDSISIKGASPYSMKSAQINIDDPTVQNDKRLPLITRKIDHNVIEHSQEANQNLFKMILNGAMESLCFNLSCLNQELVKTGSPTFSEPGDFLTGLPVCKKCGTPVDYTYLKKKKADDQEESDDQNKGKGKKKKTKKGLAASSRINFKCTKCSKKGWFSIKNRPEFQGLAMACYNKDNHLLGYISVITLMKGKCSEPINSLREKIKLSSPGFVNFMNISLDNRVRINYPGLWLEKDIYLSEISEKNPLVLKNSIRLEDNKNKLDLFTVVPENVASFIAEAFREKLNFYKAAGN
jgi:hypothetical protein